jgi:WD40 repeat protein
MNGYVTNLTNIIKIENNISFKFEGKLYYLLLCKTEASIILQLKEVNSMVNYTANMMISELKQERLFYNCDTIEDLKEIIDQIISEGKIILQVGKDNTYKLTLFDKHTNKYVSANILLKCEEFINSDNAVNRINELLNTLHMRVKIEVISNLFHNSINETSVLKNDEELDIKFKKLYDIQSKLKGENFLKAVNAFNNYVVHSDLTDSLIIKMALYKDILADLQDNEIVNLLKQCFLSLNDTISNHFIIDYNKMKEELLKQSIKEEGLYQSIKELKESILNQNIKEEVLNQVIKELKEEISNKNTKEEYSLSTNGVESNISNIKDGFSKTVIGVNESIQTISFSLNNLKKLYDEQHNDLELRSEINNLVLYCNQAIKDIQDNTTKLLNHIDENTSLSEKLKKINGNVIIGKHEREINSMILLTNNSVATASCDNTIKIWDLDTNSLMKTLIGHKDTVYSLVLLHDGNIASGSADKTIRIWHSTNDFKLITSLYGHKDHIGCLLVLENGKLVSGSFDGQLKVWACNNYECIATVKAHKDGVTTLINLMSDCFASGSGDKTIKIWDSYYKCINTIQEDDRIFSLLLLPGNNIASGSYNIKLWKCANNYKDIKCAGVSVSRGSVRCLYLVNDKYLLSESSHHKIEIVDIKNDYDCINTLTGHTFDIKAILITKNNRLITASGDKTIRLWN